jgi:O-antigen ligase
MATREVLQGRPRGRGDGGSERRRGKGVGRNAVGGDGGTGVETFAYAYYQYKPAGHNLTSEWDYLYNKAHNEYLNYLATTGAFGLGTYLLFLIGVAVVSAISLIKKKLEPSHGFDQKTTLILILGLGSGWVSILVSNFFGFSVVIMNIFLFLFPMFILMLAEMIYPDKALALGKDSTETKN